MNQTIDTISVGLTRAWTDFMAFIPAFLLFVVILVVGYFVGKLVGRMVAALLRRMDFNRVGQQQPVRAMVGERSYDYAGIVGAIAKWTVFLFALQLAFGVFPTNPISTLLSSFILYLPNIFFAVVILAAAAFLAGAVQRILARTLARLSFGGTIATVAAGMIIAVGIFAALDELNVAQAIVNGLFYGMIAIIVGSSIIAIGCGGIAPMRGQWERALGRVHREGIRMRAEETVEGGEKVLHPNEPTSSRFNPE
jgi:hypothetical protein